MSDDVPPFSVELAPEWCPKVRARMPRTHGTHGQWPDRPRGELARVRARPQWMDVVECRVRFGLNVVILLACVPLIVMALIPRSRVPRAFFPSWYDTLWILRLVRGVRCARRSSPYLWLILICALARALAPRSRRAQGLDGIIGAYAAILAVVYTQGVFIYDFGIYSYIVAISIKSAYDIHMWERMKTSREIGFVFWYCMLLNRIAANNYTGNGFILILQADVLFPIALIAFEFIPFPCERFLSFQSQGFLDDFGRAVRHARAGPPRPRAGQGRSSPSGV